RGRGKVGAAPRSYLVAGSGDAEFLYWFGDKKRQTLRKAHAFQRDVALQLQSDSARPVGEGTAKKRPYSRSISIPSSRRAHTAFAEEGYKDGKKWRGFPMLVLSRRVGEEVIIGEGIRVTVLAVRGERIRLGITAPASVRVVRQEVHQREGESLAQA